MTLLNAYHQFLFLASCVATASAASQYFELSPSKNLTVARGSSLTIPCKVRNRLGECLWMHDGKGIGIIRNKYEFRRSPDNGDCGLTIYDVSLDSDNGFWQCQVTAVAVGQQTLQSETISLLVLISPERPNIRRTHPYTPELQVLANQDNAIECSVANGNPAPKISWLLNGRNITDHAETVVSRNAKTLAYTATSKLSDYRIQRQENRFNLTCYSEHPTSNQADSVILNVLYPPIVNVSKSRYSVMEGVDLRIECLVDANPKANVLWKRIGSTSPVQTSRTESHILSFDRVTRDLDASLFECQAQNEYGISEPALVSLDVLYTPRLLNTSSAQSVMTGSPATLFCNYEGNPRPSIKWFYINPRATDPTAINNENRDQSILYIENTTYSHEGEYYCEATNQINTIDYVVRSSNIVLDVYGLPAFLTKSPFNSQGRKGDQSEVSLWFCADPPPNTAYWKFGSIRLDAIKKANMSVSTRYVIRPIAPLPTKRGPDSASHCYDSTLLIRDTDFSDERDYVLVIENDRGANEGVVQLRVVTPLSAMALSAIALFIIIVILVIGFVTLLMVRKARRKGDGSIRDEEEGKEDAAALSQTVVSNKGAGGGDHKGGNGRHELVYANLDFEKQQQPQQPSGQPVNGSAAVDHTPAVKVKPVPKPKPPKVAQRHNNSRPANSTEYAQIAFSNKIDL